MGRWPRAEWERPRSAWVALLVVKSNMANETAAVSRSTLALADGRSEEPAISFVAPFAAADNFAALVAWAAG